MIRFNFVQNFNQTDFLDWIIVALLVLLPVFLLVRLARKKNIIGSRRWLRLGLNLTLWLVLLGYILEPTWTTRMDSNQILLVGAEVSSALVRQLKDSLRISHSQRVEDFLRAEENSAGNRPDSITLVGQSFPGDILRRLTDRTVRWVPYWGPDQVQSLHWKGILRRGEKQKVVGDINSGREQYIRLRFANQTLDSVKLQAGLNHFKLEFPAFSVGRTETLLTLGEQVLDTVRYFARPTKPLNILFILDSPDFESKSLANWLGKQGHSVQVSANLSRDIASTLTINPTRNKEVDLIISDPEHVTHPQVKKAVAEGKSVLFMNMVEPSRQIPFLNRSLGTIWKVRKVGNEPTVPVGNSLSALPYSFTEAINQVEVPGLPVAVQRTTGKVGVSLLMETFPLQLSGDSVAYQKVWTAVLAELQPVSPDNIQAEAPLFTRNKELLRFNNFSSTLSSVRLGTDTLFPDYSPLNPLSAELNYRPGRSGWVKIQDSLELFVENEAGLGTLRQAEMIREYLRAQSGYQVQRASGVPANNRVQEVQVPDWVWLLLFILCFTALWVEPRWKPA
ncbi:hypothetical protein [Telluribacter sp.]|jgi:hypothetical protein|uniref:hypothetical protein n=1 Tax=Telluribacter sp. TaxID=1978767 RepID=UPI002E1341C2|nr:hypothetical protein [Telluribacter sp.]